MRDFHRAGAAFALLVVGTAVKAQDSAGEAARKVCAGTVTSEALVRAALDRAKEVASLNAFITLDESGALAAAKRVDAQRKAGGKACGPLAGVPVFLGVIQNTDPGSNAGVPGLQIPIGLGTESKLPIGLELDGAAGSDRRLIAVGMAIEKLLGRLPPPRPTR